MKRLVIDDLYVSYKKKKEKIEVIKGLSLELSDNETLVILGASGCGKTTLLKAICGVVDIDSGSIMLSGLDALKVPVKNRNISYVSQSFFTYDFMTVYNNIALPLKAAKVPIDEIDRRVHSVSKKLGIEFLLSRKPKVLSGGQRQRVALARALIKSPDLYLFDEPFSNLDPLVRNDLKEEVKRIKKEFNTAMIFVTHDINDAISLADRVLIMENGRFVKEETVENLKKNVKSYIFED